VFRLKQGLVRFSGEGTDAKHVQNLELADYH